MSIWPAASYGAPASDSPPHRPQLRAVPRAVARPPRMPFVLLVVGILATGLIGLLLLNTALAQGSFRMHDLQHRAALGADEEQQLQIEVDNFGTPRHLAHAARKLGLVPALEPGFLQLNDGHVLGDPQPAHLPPPPPAPSAGPSVSPSNAAVATTHAGTQQGHPTQTQTQQQNQQQTNTKPVQHHHRAGHR